MGMIHLNPQPKDLSQGGTIDGPLILSNNNDAIGTLYHSPALCIGGNPDEAHIEIDNNEIIAKKNATEVTTLYIQYDGGYINIGSVAHPVTLYLNGVNVTTKLTS